MSLELGGLQKLFESLDPKNQRYAQREITRYFRRQFVKRLKQQKDVAGTPFKARIRRDEKRKMLQGFTSPRRLLARYHNAGFAIGYTGKSAERARIHNLGLSDRIRNRLGATVTAFYPECNWVGYNDEDITQVHLILSRYLGKS